MNMIVVIVVVAVIALLVGGIYNQLVRRRNEVDNAWSQIDVQLKRRLDLIPNLVETVKGYAAHEKTALEAVIAARNSAMSTGSSPHEQAAADNAVSSALRQLFALSEAYPDLKASANFAALQDELATTENKVAFSRQFYNDTVRQLNTALKTIPTNFFAGFAKVSEREFYEVSDPQDREVPNVKF
jgi:LemA protein